MKFNYETMQVPFAVKSDTTISDSCKLETYTVKELRALFITQCFENGIDTTFVMFGLDSCDALKKRCMNAYIRFISSPRSMDAFSFFNICYGDAKLIEMLDMELQNAAKGWNSKYLKYGSGFSYSEDEVQSVMKNNFTVKLVNSGFGEIHAYAFGDITKALLHVICDKQDARIQKLISIILSCDAISPIEVFTALRTASKDADFLISYYYAILIRFMRVGDSYEETMSEVCKYYGIHKF